MNRERRVKIEKEARALQLEIYHRAPIMFPTGVPPLTRLFEPDVAARVCGYEYEMRESLGRGGVGAEQFETAGIVDNQRLVIMVSTAFPYETQRFTAAHEVGHLVLHSQNTAMRLHRDRPLSGSHDGGRLEIEQEADYFAAYFLAPPKLVRTEFEKRFGPSPVALTNDTAHWLKGPAMHELLNAKTGSLEFPAALASAKRYGSRQFNSMANAFGMSVKAMAIRLQELGLAVY